MSEDATVPMDGLDGEKSRYSKQKRLGESWNRNEQKVMSMREGELSLKSIIREYSKSSLQNSVNHSVDRIAAGSQLSVREQSLQSLSRGPFRNRHEILRGEVRLEGGNEFGVGR